MREGMTRHELATGHAFWAETLPDSLVLDEREFAIAWGFHPGDYHRIKMHGRLVATPRWQQAYGRDYEYTGRVNTALPLETLTAAVGRIQTIVSWSREEIDGRLNGLLLNWYDGNLGHYIGRHRDSTRNMIEGAPIVTLSFGESRRFRLRPYRAPTEPVDFEAGNGTVFVMPYETNLAWTAYSGQSERAIRFKMNAPSGAS